MTITHEAFVAKVNALYDTYRPNDDVLQRLGHIDLTTVCAPSGMGKDTLIAATGIFRVLAETTREPRMNNGVMERHGVEYKFRGNELDKVLEELRNGEFVQIGMGPGRNRFYGSSIAGYPSEGPALMDLMTSQIQAMRELPLRSLTTAYVVAPSYEAWLGRLAQRNVFSPEEWVARQAEAVASLTEALDGEYTFIINDTLPEAADTLRRLATEGAINPSESKKARNIATTILRRLEQEYVD